MKATYKSYTKIVMITATFIFLFIFQSSLLSKTSNNISEKLLVACPMHNRCGIMNLNEKYLVEPKYRKISYLFINGYSVVEDEYFRYGLMDIYGKWKLKPTLTSVSYFGEGLYAARDEKNEDFGYIDSSGNWIIEPQFTYAYDFNQGVARVVVGSNVGLIDKKGAWVLRPTLKSISPFHTGLAMAEIFVDDVSHNRFGYINTKGEWVIPPDYSEIEIFYNSDYVAARKFDVSKPNGKGQLVYLDRKGKIYLENPRKILPATENSPELDFSAPSEDMSPWRDEKSGKVGFMNVSGEWAIPPIFDWANMFQEIGLAKAYLEGKWGLINKLGEWVVPAQYEYEGFASDFEDGLSIIMQNDGNMGIINSEGKWVIEPRYETLVYISFFDWQDDTPNP